MVWKSGVSSCTFFLAFFCLLVLPPYTVLFAFTVAHFSLSFILFYDISLSSAGLISVICHPTKLLQQLKRSVNFNTSWLQAGFKQNKITGLCWLSYYTITVQGKKKKQMWLQGPEIQMKVLLLPIVEKRLHHVWILTDGGALRCRTHLSLPSTPCPEQLSYKGLRLFYMSHATSAHCYFYLYSRITADPFSWVLDKPTEIQ